MKPDVSIVVAVYNAEVYITRCLESLIHQTYRDIEIICVNDASTDRSQQIIDEYRLKDQRIRSIVHEENMNAGGAMNDGIKAAQGEYVCIVDNDDWIAENAIETLLQASEDKKYDVVSCDWYDYRNKKDFVINNNLAYCLDKEEIIKHALLYGYRLLGALVRRSIFMDNNLFFPEKVFYEDNAIGICILFYAKSIKPVHETLYYYYLSDNSVTRSSSLKKFEDRVYTTELFLENLINRGFANDLNKELIDYKYIRLSFSTLFRLSSFTGRGGYKIAKMVSNRIKEKMPNKFITYHCAGYDNKFMHPMRYYMIARVKNYLLKCIPSIIEGKQ